MRGNTSVLREEGYKRREKVDHSLRALQETDDIVELRRNYLEKYPNAPDSQLTEGFLRNFYSNIKK